ncbi:hypothetical protein TRVL_09795 [Trypanosoma vivax]|nr:hypothetical protein TRVL_09795 [Trypanosoma vivax]
MRFFALDESEAAKKQMLGRSSVNRSCLLAREPLCAASGRFIRRFFAFSVLPCGKAFVCVENLRKSRCMALLARGPLTLLRGILGKEPSHGYSTLRDGGASEMNDPTVLPVVFARVQNSGWALAHCVAHRFAHRESNAEVRRISAKGFFFARPSTWAFSSPNFGFIPKSSHSLVPFSGAFLKGAAFFHQFNYER